MTSASANPTPAKIVPSEVGWQFVPQYYTFVNKQPNRLHCFYTKNSTFIHGTEGEDGKPCYGQHEIHQKILSIGFQDCKVFIHSVDAQSSANNGIIIQVIGEMSNNGEPWRKFAQTFFLAEQPNGYFVLNDIFRFLKEEADDADDQVSEDDAPADEDVRPEPALVAEASYLTIPQQPSRVEPPNTMEVPLVPAETPKDIPPITNGVNGAHPTSEAPDSPEPENVSLAPIETDVLVAEPPTTVPLSPPSSPPRVASPIQTPIVVPEATPPTPVEKADEPVAPVPAVAMPSTPPAVPSKPAPPKTWANLAAAKPGSWGTNLAADSKGVSAAATSAHAATVPPKANGPRAPVASPPADGVANIHPTVAAANAVTTAQCFVKSVTEQVNPTLLREILVSRFGPIKELEIVRSKACAFLEFHSVESARRAILASLPTTQGGEGGIRIGEGDPAALLHNRDVPRITVETRKDRADRPPPRPHSGARGGPPPGADSRGGFRGGPGGGRGRGAPRGAPNSTK